MISASLGIQNQDRTLEAALQFLAHILVRSETADIRPVDLLSRLMPNHCRASLTCSNYDLRTNEPRAVDSYDISGKFKRS